MSHSAPHTVFLVAMSYEIENIYKLDEWKQLAEAPFPVYQHRDKPQTVIIQTGIGKVNAAAATQYALDTYPDVQRFINLGTVGCLNTDIPIGEVRAVEACRFFDVDVTAFNYKLGQVPESPIADYPLDADPHYKPAGVLTGDQFIASPESLKDILKEFPADFIEMELAAIAHTLHRNDRLEQLRSYKAPSDYCNGESTKDFYANEHLAFTHLSSVAHSLID